jgi:hypothetical protein
MDAEGPQLELLTHWMTECPPEFLAEPGHGKGQIDLIAIVSDHFRSMDCLPHELIDAKLLQGDRGQATVNRLKLIAVATWLLHCEPLRTQAELVNSMYELLTAGLDELALVVRAEIAVNDPDRREEFVRLCLKQLGLRPKGETQSQAADRLTALDSVERSEVVRQTRAAEKRAREVRQMMARRAAEEAAAKASRE